MGKGQRRPQHRLIQSPHSPPLGLLEVSSELCLQTLHFIALGGCALEKAQRGQVAYLETHSISLVLGLQSCGFESQNQEQNSQEACPAQNRTPQSTRKEL